MELGQIEIAGMKLPTYRCNTLVVGSGAAALNCAWHLRSFGVGHVVIATEHLGGGVSNNSGSDKQTYYKLSLFGEEQDSVYDMAQTLFSGGAMHGDIALVEAALSVQEFYHLVQIGVPFPHNEYGGYVGYKTDHDPKQRATSAGPWTSNQMYQKLLVQVRQADIPILDQHEIISLLVADDRDGQRRVVGALAIDKSKAELGAGSFVVFQAENVVMGTGGPGGLFAASVFPEGHLGSTGVALEAGAAAANLTEWQFGLASTKFRWNVSGTYQQVIPRYISTAQDGSDQRDFLNEYFPSMGKQASAVFLKGYQWPFDPRKIQNYGSSLVDILVYNETVVKGRRVFMDFRSNPVSSSGLEPFSLDDLEPEAYTYLEKSEALFGTPIDRLRHMNPMAIELYKQHGIDLENEPLEIAVCAQHSNGGLVGNIWWESNLKHLFPVGEANGSHGVYRPGGSALNAGQVGGYRAAQYIAHRYNPSSMDDDSFMQCVSEQLREKVHLANGLLERASSVDSDLNSIRLSMQNRMTRTAGHIRELSSVQKAIKEAQGEYAALCQGQIRVDSPKDLVVYFQNRQLCLTQLALLKSIEAYLTEGGGSRGSCLVVDENGEPVLPGVPELDELKYRPEEARLRKSVLEYRYQDGEHISSWVPVRPIPRDDFWFENVWSDYLGGEFFTPK